MSQEETTATGTDPLHIGNLIGILSDQHGLVVGHVVYRDKELVRVRPQDTSDRAVEFPMTEDGAAFDPELGVHEVEVMEEATSDYYVDFLGARPGEMLEFFTVDGEEADKPGEVSEVIKTASKDSIRLKDGRVLNFRGRGPKAPIAVIRVTTSVNVAAAAATGEEIAAVEDTAAVAAAAAQKRRTEILALLSEAVPVATVAVVPAAQQTYPESLQREEMFQDLLAQLPKRQRTNPRRIRFIEREVDLALALKSNVLLRDEVGNPDGFREVETRTLLEAIKAAPGPVPVAVPIVAGARVLNVDEIPVGAKYRPDDVAPRVLGDVEMESEVIASIYQDGSLSTTRATRVKAALQETAAQRAAQGFYGYLYDLLGRDQVTLKGDIATGVEWTADQDIIRTAGLGKAVQGFRKDLTVTGKLSLSVLADDVTTRSLRALTPLKYTNPRTGETYVAAPSDPSHVTGYVMLPPKAALKLRPPTRPGDLPTALLYSAALEDDNLPTIAEALRDLYSADPEPQNAWTLSAEEGGPGADMEVAKWLETVLRYAVHPSESLGPRTPRILSVLDAFGLGETDLPQPVAAVIHRWVRQSQAQWRDLLTTQRSATQKALNEDVARVFQSVTGADSPLWPALLAAPAPLSEVIADIRRRNPAIGEAPTLLSVSLQHEAQGDAAPLAWGLIAGLDNRLIAVDQAAAADALTASRSYVLRRKALRDLPLLKLRATPEINTCPHVATLEAIRNQRDTLQRSRLLRQFIDEYEGQNEGDWITCGLCQQQAVCHHELMELEAMAQPARMADIQKKILVLYGGSRFEGKVICRNCGQALQDIDYDEGVEFDDEGRPITGMSVLTEEQMEEPTESTWKKATAALVAAPVDFDSPEKRQLADILQFLAGRAGFVLTPDLIRTIVTRAEQFARAYTLTRERFEAYQKRQITSASAKVTAVTGVRGTVSYVSNVPTYESFVDQQRVVAIAALLAIALQTADPPIVVTNPVALCHPFSREGWPLAENAPPMESKMVRYIACTVASIDQPFAPWNHLTWVTAGGKLEKRTEIVLKALVSAVSGIIKPDTGKPEMTYRNEVTMEFQKMRDDEEGAKLRALVSLTDELPVGFRPEPFPPAVGRPAVERDPAAPVAAALAAGRTDEVAEKIPGIAGAMRQQAVALIGELHAAAAAGVPKGVPITSVDATCCPTPFRDVEAGVLRGAPAAASLEAAAALARRGQPFVPNAGSHLWATFTPPIRPPVEESVDSGVYFKLFLKYCYTGPQVGEAHEFSAGNRCRQCGLALGKSLELVDFSKEGAAILDSQEGALKVSVSPAAFEALSQAVRRRRLLVAEKAEEEEAAAWETGILEFAKALDKTQSAGLKALAAATRESVTAVKAGGAAAAADELVRVQLWAPVTLIHDAAQAAVIDRVGPLVPRGGRAGEKRAEEAREAIKMVNTLLEDPWVEGPRALQEYWCAKTLAEGRQKFITSVKGARWFKLSPKHNDIINAFLTKNAEWFSGELPAEARPVIAAIGELLGPVIRVWIRSVRPVPSAVAATVGWGTAEAQQLLRAVLFQVWQDATNPLSELYADFTTSGERETLAGVVANWTRILMLHVKQQFVRYSDDRVRQIIQQQAEMERSSIVKEFSDIKDDEQRAAEVAKKQFRIGRWARGANLTKLDADRFDEEIEQRRAMGIVEAPVDPLLLEVPAAAAGGAADFGFRAGAPEEASAYDVDQGADGDNY